MMKKTFGFSVFDAMHVVLLFSADVIAVAGVLWVGHRLWLISSFRIHANPPPLIIADFIVSVGIIVFILIWRGTYRLHNSVMHVVKLKDLISATIIGYLMVMLIGFFTKSLIISRLWAFYSFLLLIPALIIERALVDECWSKCIARGINKQKVLIYGAGFTGRRLVKSLKKLTKLNYEVVGFIDDTQKDSHAVSDHSTQILGSFEDIEKIVTDKRVQSIIITMPNAAAESMKQIIALCERLKVDYKFVPGMMDMALHRVQMEIIDGVPLFSPKMLKFTRVNRFFKRSFDLLFSSVFLVLLSPLFIVLAILIKKDTPGPALFKHKRIGRNGVEFEMYKFRSMYSDAPQYAINPLDRDDPRVTPMGRFLRRTSLDELPQLFNVVRGEMSLVGPRPEMPFIVKAYTEMQRERLNVKPGITGLWQISADRALPIHENIDHDLYYIEHQSLLLDIVIIIETLFFAIRGIGAR